MKTETTRGSLDLIAIERAVNGDLPEGMTGLELFEATRILIAQGRGTHAIAEILRVPTETLRRWYPVELARPAIDLSPAKCGTVRGYRAHRARKEPTCQKCRTANSAVDRARKTFQPVPEELVA
ncbi:hypothetical protein ACFU98_44395 [Streptomyces sp. NPDC057575]|uniref:hypothetical protein n=1 Tax=unclassified Streptomyces TaxID=2593676 RepID=UPI003675F9DE